MPNELLIRSLYIDKGAIDEDSYVSRIPALNGISELMFDSAVTFFVGENGSGKSTLLEAMAVASGFNPEGGTINYRFSTRDSHSALHKALQISKSFKKRSWGLFLRAESFYNMATYEEEYNSSISRRYHERSHGESFLDIMQNNFEPGGLYFLDEPEAALSPQRQLTLLVEINNCAKSGAQFFIATHSPILLALPNSSILSFDGGIHPVDYTETESFQITEMIINHKDQILHRLLSYE